MACTQTMSRFLRDPHTIFPQRRSVGSSPSLDNLDMVGFEVGIFRLSIRHAGEVPQLSQIWLVSLSCAALRHVRIKT